MSVHSGAIPVSVPVSVPSSMTVDHMPTSSASLVETFTQGMVDFLPLHKLHTIDESTIRNFTFEQGVTPLSSIIGVAICVAMYFATVRLMQKWVKARGKPFDLKGVRQTPTHRQGK